MTMFRCCSGHKKPHSFPVNCLPRLIDSTVSILFIRSDLVTVIPHILVQTHLQVRAILTIGTVFHVRAIVAIGTIRHIRTWPAFFAAGAVTAKGTIDTVGTIRALEFSVSIFQQRLKRQPIVIYWSKMLQGKKKVMSEHTLLHPAKWSWALDCQTWWQRAGSPLQLWQLLLFLFPSSLLG